jgi:hypothetical protein
MAFRQELEERLNGLGAVESDELRDPVTYDVYQNPLVLPCGHNLDQKCIDDGFTRCLFGCVQNLDDAYADDLLIKRIRDAKVDEKLDWSDRHASSAEILLFCIDRSTSMAHADDWFTAMFGLSRGDSRLFIAKTFVMSLYKQLFRKASGEYIVPNNALVELITFGSDVSAVQDVSNPEELNSVLRSVQADHAHSAVFDGVFKAIQIVQTYPKAKFRIVILTDGGETGHSDCSKQAQVEAEMKEQSGQFKTSFWARSMRNIMFCCVGSPAGQAQGKKFADRYGMEFMALNASNVHEKARDLKSGFLKGIFHEKLQKEKATPAVTPNAVEILAALSVPSKKIKKVEDDADVEEVVHEG